MDIRCVSLLATGTSAWQGKDIVTQVKCHHLPTYLRPSFRKPSTVFWRILFLMYCISASCICCRNKNTELDSWKYSELPRTPQGKQQLKSTTTISLPVDNNYPVVNRLLEVWEAFDTETSDSTFLLSGWTIFVLCPLYPVYPITTGLMETLAKTIVSGEVLGVSVSMRIHPCSTILKLSEKTR